MKQSSIWLNYFDIVILPPRPVRDHAIALSKRLKPYGGDFVLGARSFLPHISLYHIPVCRKDFALFAATVKQIAAEAKSGSLRLRSIEMPVIMTDKPSWLVRLHKEIVKNTSPFLDFDYGVESYWHTEYLPLRLRAEARSNLRKFGSPLIHHVFRPHITLTSLPNNRVARGVRLPLEPLSFTVAEIAICELGPHHTCQRTIAKFPLGV